LAREYLLELKDEVREMRKHSEIFKICAPSSEEDFLPARSSPGGGSETVTVDGEAPHTESEGAERDELVAQLRHAESLGQDEYKRLINRLYKS
jgi:hypothetical protein